MSKTVAHTRVSEGGLGIPHLTQELQVLSLSTVERWGQPVAGAPPAIGLELLRDCGADDGLLSPSRRAASTSLSLQQTLAATGWQVRRSLAATTRCSTELDLLRPLLLHVGRGTSVDFGWDHGWLCCRYNRVEDLLLPLRNFHGTSYGNVQLHALLQARITGEDIFLYKQLSPVCVADFHGVFSATDRLQDVLTIDWDEKGSIRFRSVRHDAPLPPLFSDRFRRFCDMVVFNYPCLLRPAPQPEDLVLRPPTLDVWRLRPVTAGYVLDWSPVHQASVCLGFVSSTADATAAARRALASKTCAFERHQWLDAPFAIWTGVRPPTPHAAHDILRCPADARCTAEATGRQRTWERADSVIADALTTVLWQPLMSTHGTPSAQRLLFHKVKGNRLNGWDRANERRGCPHCPAIGKDGGTTFHIIWACPRARDQWQHLLDFWAPLRTCQRSVHGEDTKRDIFGLKLRSLPDRLWQLPELTRLGEPSANATVATGLTLNAIWRRHVLLT